VPYTVGDAGSSLTFQINQSDVGPASSFSLNAYAVNGGTGGLAGSSWIGSNYAGFPGGVIANAVNTAIWIYVGVLVGVLVIVLVLVVVIVLVVRRKKPPTQSYPPAYAPSDPSQGTPAGWAHTPHPPTPPPPPPPPPPLVHVSGEAHFGAALGRVRAGTRAEPPDRHARPSPCGRRSANA
jgi:hypothetical protein